jgi:hypothetical protein
MTVKELIDQLLGAPMDAPVAIAVHCPRGGNSLPAEIDRIVVGTDSNKLFIELSPADGVEYEVFDAEEEEDEDEEPDFGKCKRCGEWVHFPCCNCIARDLEEGKI